MNGAIVVVISSKEETKSKNKLGKVSIFNHIRCNIHNAYDPKHVNVSYKISLYSLLSPFSLLKLNTFTEDDERDTRIAAANATN